MVPKGTLNSCMAGITQNEENRYILIETIDEPYAKNVIKINHYMNYRHQKAISGRPKSAGPFFLVPPMQLLDGIEGMPYIIIYI